MTSLRALAVAALVAGGGILAIPSQAEASWLNKLAKVINCLTTAGGSDYCQR